MDFLLFLLNIPSIICRGVLPSLSLLLMSAPLAIISRTNYGSSLKTARCRELPIGPPPRSTRLPADSNIYAALILSSRKARHKADQSSLSSKLRSALKLMKPYITPRHPSVAARCSAVHFFFGSYRFTL